MVSRETAQRAMHGRYELTNPADAAPGPARYVAGRSHCPSITCPTLVFAGELLLYLYFMMPFGVEKALSVVSLSAPPQAELFGTVWPYFSFLNLAALGLAAAIAVFGSISPVLRNKPFVIYLLVNVLAIFWMLISRPSGQSVYWDYALEFLRLSSFVILALVVFGERQYDPRILARGLILLLGVPVILQVFTNMSSFLSEREGRVNAPGLEITSTGHVSAIAVLLGLTLPVSRSLRAALLVVGGLSLLQSGSRIALLFCCGMALFVLLRGSGGLIKR